MALLPGLPLVWKVNAENVLQPPNLVEDIVEEAFLELRHASLEIRGNHPAREEVSSFVNDPPRYLLAQSWSELVAKLDHSLHEQDLTKF